MVCSFDWAAPPKEVVADLKDHLATGWPLCEPPWGSFLCISATGSASAALGAGPADGTPCPSPGVCSMRSFLSLAPWQGLSIRKEGGCYTLVGCLAWRWRHVVKVQTHPVLVLAISGAWTSRVLYRQRASVLAPCSPPPERAANRNSPGFSISRRALGFTQSPWGFPLSSSSSPSLEHELPLSPDSWSTYFHGYKHLEMSAPFTDKK